MISCFGIYINILLMQYLTEARSQEELYKHSEVSQHSKKRWWQKTTPLLSLLESHVVPDNSASYHLHPRYSIYYLYVAGWHKGMDG